MRSAVRSEQRLDRAGTEAVVWLDDPRAQAPGLAGAKGAALATARHADLPVLPGFVVSTSFDRAHSAHLAQLRDAWCTLSHAGELSLVVRSSSTIEDSDATSMAGMFTSVLDVGGWEQFEAAVETVLASSNVVPLGEAREAGASAVGQAPMAVLVQPYLSAASGGVLFGLDPVTGRDDRLIVSATDRGPAALVGGEVDGSRYVLNRRGRLLDGPKDDALLVRSQLRALARVARLAESVFGGPQDIEWAFETDGTLRLLQSRPVTARGDSGAAEGPVFGPGPVAETFPEPLSPLEQDLWADPLRDALRHALTLAGTAPSRRLAASPIVTAVGGRLAVDLSVMPDGTGGRRSFAARLDPRPPMRKLTAAWRVGRLRAALPVLAGDLIAKADEDLLAVDSLPTLSDTALVGLLRTSRQGLTALHGHEVLMGWLVDTATSTVTAASVAMRLLAEGRAAGLSDEEIIARDPGVLALTPPHISARTELPPPLGELPPLPASSGATDPGDPAILREALRLRARWVQELMARAAWELGVRMARANLLAGPEQVAWLGLDELETAVRDKSAPAGLEARRPVLSAPLPARFRVTSAGSVVAVVDRKRRAGDGGAQGAGGGRGVGIVHDGSPVPAQGAVLVVRTLDPGLASLLPRLGGLIAETGSPLSHLAILAREVGVPTVVGVEGATTRFPAGALVVVDGTSGEVSRVDKERGAA